MSRTRGAAVIALLWLVGSFVTQVAADSGNLPPAWVNQGSRIVGEDLVGVGVAQGPMSDDWAAYVDALLNMSLVIRTRSTSLTRSSLSSLPDSQDFREKIAEFSNDEFAAKVMSEAVPLVSGVWCAQLVKIHLGEITPVDQGDVVLTPTQFTWFEEQRVRKPSSEGYDIRQRIRMTAANAKSRQGKTTKYFESVGRCELESPEAVSARLPIEERYQQRRPDGSVITYVQVRVALSSVLSDMQAVQPRGTPSLFEWLSDLSSVGNDRDLGSPEDAPLLARTLPRCDAGSEHVKEVAPLWPIQKGAAFGSEEGVFYGVGSSTWFPNVRLQRKFAEATARVNLAVGLQTAKRVTTRTLSEGESSSAPGPTDEPIRDALDMVTRMSLVHSSVEQFWQDPCTGEVYALVSIDTRQTKKHTGPLGHVVPN